MSLSEYELNAPPPTTIHPPYERTWPPNYVEVFAWRKKQFTLLQGNPQLIRGAKAYYKDHWADFINHWCTTFDPRLAGTGRPTFMPFIMFERQAVMVEFLYDCILHNEPGLLEKSRDMGATWVACAVSVIMFLFWEGVTISWGSRKEDLVDRRGDPNSIFQKMRVIVEKLPPFFLPRNFSPKMHMAHMRFVNPETGSTIVGECGDDIGRGGRSKVAFLDEYAHLEHQESVDAAMSANTDCQIMISSVNGLGNVFHRRRESGVVWEPALAA
jgi:phage terminase large subunit